MRKLFIIPILLCSTLSATEFEIKDEALFVPSTLKNIKVTYNNGQFSVSKNDLNHSIQNYDLDAQLRSIVHNNQLEQFLQQGYISVKERSDGSFRLESHLRLRGGGPWFATAMLITSLTGHLATGVGIVTVNPALIAAGVSISSFGEVNLATALIAPTP